MKYQFPTMLRKMWSGQEVQEWLDNIINSKASAAPEHESTAVFEECSTCGDRVATLSKCHNIGAVSLPEQEAVAEVVSAYSGDPDSRNNKTVKVITELPVIGTKLYPYPSIEIERLQALSVENIMIDVVPGEDGMGEEIYAKSVADVHAAFGKMVDREEDLEQKLSKAQALVRKFLDGKTPVRELVAECETFLSASASHPVTDWLSMDSAPKDGTMLRLLVEFDEHQTEDAMVAPTIGFNNHANDGQDEWQFAGWCWSHDHFTQGKGTVKGWLPFL